MTFADLRSRIVAVIAGRIRNGEWTERSLARRAGMSQPHLHNVLKGVRVPSPEITDRLLTVARLSVLDLFTLAEAEEIRRRALIASGGVPILPPRTPPLPGAQFRPS